MDISISANVSTARFKTVPRTLYSEAYLSFYSGANASAVTFSLPVRVVASIASARTLSRTLYIDQYIQVSGSICSAMFVTYSPVSSSFTSSIPITRLYNGFPRPQDYLVSTKVAVVGGKIAYKLTRNYWTTKL